MPDRLNTIVTRGGDAGETSLGDGSRRPKHDPRVCLLGDVDELNASIGVVRAHGPDGDVDGVLEGVQHDLFDLGGALCFPGATLLSPAHVRRLDDAAAALNATLPPLKEFVLPGGAPIVASLHVARTVCRRVERNASAFFSGGEEAAGLTADAAAYLNRLSDYLFIAARTEARRAGAGETLWQKSKSIAPGE
ncbi:MAG: cob(I)yrinic acid a,c-diamide adenosyltransferase [Alphaproteobacteria bacterium]|nr:cob(I)yrinic acid a,c-diamide adenosyltransferase [Alphaproteobacteria bacterium]